MMINFKRRSAVLCLVSSLTVLITVFADLTPAQQTHKRQSETIRRLNRSIYDAAVYKESNVRPLHPLEFDSSTLTTKVVTLTGYNYAKGSNTLSRDVWVTAVPEVRDKCQGVRGDLAMWLRELLGLHPDSNVTHFVLIEVKKGDIFRPAADPDPARKWPCSDPQTKNCGESFPEGASDPHIKWIANQMLGAYVISKTLKEDGYPWTRLGYTYNWRRGADRYGASEYVIRQGSVVDVKEIIPYQDYCRRK